MGTQFPATVLGHPTRPKQFTTETRRTAEDARRTTLLWFFRVISVVLRVSVVNCLGRDQAADSPARLALRVSTCRLSQSIWSLMVCRVALAASQSSARFRSSSVNTGDSASRW
jgi:hypothetical protein